MSRFRSKTSFNESFERALRAAQNRSGIAPDAGTLRAKEGLVRAKDRVKESAKEVRAKELPLASLKKNETKRRFIGKSQLDITYKGFRSLPGNPGLPWYVVSIAVGKIRHKFSLGAPAIWSKDFKTPMDDGLVDIVAQSAVRFAIDEGDDNVPDIVSDVVEQATDGHRLPDGSYTVRKNI